MQTENRLLDDLSRVATGAFSALAGVKDEVEARLKEQVERVLARLDLVTREEFEAVRLMASHAREAQERLESRVAALEAQLSAAAPVVPSDAGNVSPG